jgi:2-polyprenyl-6-methoxyphenol hydroxylase-like FAD-dependent oxidoreductase
MRSWGLADAVAAESHDAEVQLWECPTLADASVGTAHGVGYPTREQSAMISPVAPLVVAQDQAEKVLRKHIRGASTVDLALGTEVIEFADRQHDLRVTLRGRGGEIRSLSTQYVIAADGAHGDVRHRLGIGADPQPNAYGGVQVVLRAPVHTILGAARYGLYSTTAPPVPGLFLPAGRPDRWVYGPGLPVGHADHPGEDRQRLLAAIRAGIGVDDMPVTIEHVGVFNAPAQIAHRFRSGRVILIGDAAHRVTPRGGRGLNLAMQGGMHAAWKVAWVLRGWAPREFLDTYDTEQRVAAWHDVRRSTDPKGSRRPTLPELQADLGGRLTHAWLPGDAPGSGPKQSTLDLVGTGWTLVTGPRVGPWSRVAREIGVRSAPVTVRSLDALSARTIGIRGTGAMLVRPDGVPAGQWSTAAEAGVRTSPVENVGNHRCRLPILAAPVAW